MATRVMHSRTHTTHFIGADFVNTSLCGLFTFDPDTVQKSEGDRVTCQRCMAARDDTPAPNSLYPWDKWLDNDVHVISKDIEFQVTVTSMQQTLHNRASASKRKVRMFVINNRICFRFYDPKNPDQGLTLGR